MGTSVVSGYSAVCLHSSSCVCSHSGGCRNYGPVLGPYYNTAPIFLGYPKRDTLTTTHLDRRRWQLVRARLKLNPYCRGYSGYRTQLDCRVCPGMSLYSKQPVTRHTGVMGKVPEGPGSCSGVPPSGRWGLDAHYTLKNLNPETLNPQHPQPSNPQNTFNHEP